MHEMNKGNAVKARILQIVSTDWMDVSLVGAAVLTTPALKLSINGESIRTVLAYLYELRVTGLLEVRKVGKATGFNQVRRKPQVDSAA